MNLRYVLERGATSLTNEIRALVPGMEHNMLKAVSKHQAEVRAQVVSQTEVRLGTAR